MRKALVTAFVIAGGFAGCANTPPPPVAATHTVVGEASFTPTRFVPVVSVSIDPIIDVAGPNPHGPDGPGCHGSNCVPE
jgi:hypothetical protein